MVGANLTCSTETVFDGAPMVFHIWNIQFFDHSDEIYSVCAMFRANSTCSSEAMFGGVHMVFCPNGVDFTRVNFTLNACAHGVGWLNAGRVDLTRCNELTLGYCNLSGDPKWQLRQISLCDGSIEPCAAALEEETGWVGGWVDELEIFSRFKENEKARTSDWNSRFFSPGCGFGRFCPYINAS